MSNCGKIHYYVEGKCEKVFLDEFKSGPGAYFKPGRVDVFNFVNKEIPSQRLIALGANTTLVLVYDVDVENSETLDFNIQKLKKAKFKKIIHIQSIRNFEDEIVRSTNITNINKVFNTQSVDEFKSFFVKHKDIKSKLLTFNLDLSLFWSVSNTNEPFAKYSKQKDLLFIRKK